MQLIGVSNSQMYKQTKLPFSLPPCTDAASCQPKSQANESWAELVIGAIGLIVMLVAPVSANELGDSKLIPQSSGGGIELIFNFFIAIVQIIFVACGALVGLTLSFVAAILGMVHINRTNLAKTSICLTLAASGPALYLFCYYAKFGW